MKRSTIAKTFTIAAVVALAVAIPPAGVALLDGVFVQTFDGNGALTSAGLQSDNGKILQLTQTGTYTVNPDCTGTYTALVSPLGFIRITLLVIERSVYANEPFGQ